MRRHEDLSPAGPDSQGEPEIRNLDPTVHLAFATTSLGAVHSNALGIAMLPGVRCPMVMVRHRHNFPKGSVSRAPSPSYIPACMVHKLLFSLCYHVNGCSYGGLKCKQGLHFLYKFLQP